MKKPYFISFEGIEGSGKTTQIKLLARFLKRQGPPVLLTREPGGTKVGQQIRNILLHSKNKKMVPLCELFLYAASRAQHVQEVIRPALKARKIVLCDRFTDATVAYQEGGRKLLKKIIQQLNQLATGGLKPNLTFLIDCPVSVGLRRAKKRISQRKIKEDRFEREKILFHERVRKGYLKIARREGNRVKVIDGVRTKEEIFQEIIRRLNYK